MLDRHPIQPPRLAAGLQFEAHCSLNWGLGAQNQGALVKNGLPAWHSRRIRLSPTLRRCCALLSCAAGSATALRHCAA